MAFQPFHPTTANCRVVTIPAGLGAEERARFAARIQAAVRQQAVWAGRSDAVLRVSGEVVDRGGRLLIPHEPAQTLDPARVEAGPDRPDIQTLWWLTWSSLAALRAAAVENAAHGGMQPCAVFLDACGRVKVGDFGIAPTYESICGIDARRQVHCDGSPRPDEDGRTISGVWSLLDESATRDNGWISPFFGHELLEGKVRLNPKSDQFGLGVTLFMLATGTHPYGAALSDPTLMLYFHLEPYAVQDERRDWKDVFERREKELTRTADQPYLAWTELVSKLLASDPGERFANAAEALEFAERFAPPQWKEAMTAISAAMAALEAGDSAGLLAHAEPWKQSESLPALWREKIARSVERFEKEKDQIRDRLALQKRLAEAHSAMDGLDLNEARRLAREIVAHPQAEESVRRDAEALIEQCDEQEEFVRSGADRVAAHYLDSARDALKQNDLKRVRELIDAVMKDSATPAARAAQAKQLLAEVELSEQRIEQQLNELNTATEELRVARFDSARQRLNSLLAAENVPEAISAQAHMLLSDVQSTQSRRAELTEALNHARAAWERADLAELETNLAQVSPDFLDRDAAEIYDDLVSRGDRLRKALELRGAADHHLARGEADVALSFAIETAADESFPQIFRDEMLEFAHRCEEAVRARREAAQRAAASKLAAACTLFDEGKLDQCRKLLKEEVLRAPELPEEDRKRGEQLYRLCDRAERLGQTVDHASQHLADKEYDDALALLDKFDAKGLPDLLLKDRDALRARVVQEREKHEDAERALLSAQLTRASASLDAGELDAAEGTLKKVAAARLASDAHRAEIAQQQKRLKQLRPLAASLASAEALLETDAGAGPRVLAALGKFPKDLPDWAALRAAALRARVEQLETDRKTHALEKTRAALAAAEQALAAGDLAGVRASLADAKPGLSLEPGLPERSKKISDAAVAFEEWLPKVDAEQKALEGGKVAAVFRDTTELLKGERLPDLIRQRLSSLLEEARSRISGRRKEIDQELSVLSGELTSRGRRTRNFVARVDAIGGDELATREQKNRAEELAKTYAALPEPKPPWVPIGIAGGLLVVGLGVVAYLMTPGPPVPPPPTVAEQIAAQQAALQTQLDRLAGEAQKENREAPGWRVAFEPADAFPTSAFFVSSTGQRQPLGQAQNEAALGQLAVADSLRDTLFPRKVQEIRWAERLEPVCDRVQKEVNAARPPPSESEPEPPSYTVRFDPPDRVPSKLIARKDGTQEEITIADVTDADYEKAALTENLRARLYPPPVIDNTEAQRKAAEEAARKQREADELARKQREAEETARKQQEAEETARKQREADELARKQREAEETARKQQEADEAARKQQEAEESARKQQEQQDRVAQAPAQFAKALQAALPAGSSVAPLSAPDARGGVTVSVTWNNYPLAAFAGLQFNSETGDPDPSVNDVANWFLPQIAALDAMSRDGPLPVALSNEYDTGIQAASQPELALQGVEPGGAPLLSIQARLRNDPRPAASFPLGGAFRDGKLNADTAARQAFADYLSELQSERLAASAQEAARALGLPAGWSVAAPERGGGDRAELSLRRGEGGIATIPATWNRDALRYDVSTDAAKDTIRSELARLSGGPEALAALRGAWSSLRGKLAPSEGKPGAAYFGKTEIVGVKPVDGQPESLFQTPVEITVAPPNAQPGDEITFRINLEWGDTPGWDAVSLVAAQGAIESDLRAKGSDAEFRGRRKQEALREVGLTEADVGVATGDGLSATRKSGDATTEYAWRWNPADLRYTDRSEKAGGRVIEEQRGGSLEQRLQRLAASPQPDPAEFVATLAEVRSDKATRMNLANYREDSALSGGGDPLGKLAAISQRLQRSVAGDPQRDIYPSIFVEYIATPDGIFGMSWRAAPSGSHGISGVRDLAVWNVMGRAEAERYAAPDALYRACTSNAALGEKLLGIPLGKTIEGVGPGGNLGLMTAPDGILWFTRWDQVNFSNRSVQNVDWRDAVPVQSAVRLRELMKPRTLERGIQTFPRVGIWSVPSLGGSWQGGRERSIGLGKLSSRGETRVSVSEYPLGRGNEKRMAGVVSGGGVVASWGEFVSNKPRIEDFANKFWNYGWSPTTGNWAPDGAWNVLIVPAGP